MRRIPDERRRVRGFPRADRAIDAIGHLSAACANSTVRGVMVILVEPDGECDIRIFGTVKRKDMVWSGAMIQHAALIEE